MMIVVGILRWIFDYRREEIQILLSSRGIEISTGEISNLSEEFLLRFYALHKRHIPQMKELFDKDGGSILILMEVERLGILSSSQLSRVSQASR
jgi:hypothetical protein